MERVVFHMGSVPGKGFVRHQKLYSAEQHSAADVTVVA